MLRVTQQDSASGAKRYYATADYYSEGQEIVGSWGGKAADMLDLKGVVDKDSFERLCDNLHPTTAQQLTVRTRTDRTVGYDFTFSVPKSVSLLYALSGDQEALAAFREAVDETMREIETEAKTRVRKDGQDTDRVTGNLAWAEFIHTTSRPVDGLPDPQLHAHVFVFNTTWDQQEKRWKAGQFRDLKRDAPYFQAAFRVRLANKLQDLGFGVERKRDDFELSGIPADVLKRFSRRTALIEKVAEERGITDPDQKAELGASTRERKGTPLGMVALRKEWDGRLNDDERNALAAVHRRGHRVSRPLHQEQVAVDHAIDHCYVREAVVPERKLVTEALKRGLGTVTVESVRSEVAKRPLVRSDIDGRTMATTKEMLSFESRLVEFARKGRGRYRPLGDPNRPCSRAWFNEGQKAAVRHVLASRDRVIVIRGAAGTGKTTLEQEIGEALAEAGKSVVALAPSVKAGREVLRNEAGFKNADTVARFLKDQEMQAAAKSGVILVDEAGLLGTRDMLKVFDTAESVGARVILVGDRRQHRSVSAGEPLKLLEESAGLKVAEVTDILRQSGDYKKAAKALSIGRVHEALEKLDRLGWVNEVQGDERHRQLAGAYLAAIHERKRNGQHKSALVVSPTHAEIASVTQRIREQLKDQGKLIKERAIDAWIPAHLTDADKSDPTMYEPGDMVQFHQNAPGHKKGTRLVIGEGLTPPTSLANRFEVYRPSRLFLAVGDRIRISAGGKSKDGHRLSNGALLTVTGFTPRGDIVVNHGWQIDRDWGHLTHGYAVTSHASQGSTVDKVFASISAESIPATNERTAYVALTRGREEARIFTNDKSALFKAAARSDDALSAMELADASASESLRDGMKQPAHIRRPGGQIDHSMAERAHESMPERERDNER
ncbi:MAG TPA: MobF family relaxase [Gemmataceae bacterium]|nr:MobF family relaxase [Gemmataceae bacterium]